MKSLCVITIKLNTLTDVLYQITVGEAFVYVCENPFQELALKILNNGHMFVTWSVIMRFSREPRLPHYNGVAVYVYREQCCLYLDCCLFHK